MNPLIMMAVMFLPLFVIFIQQQNTRRILVAMRIIKAKKAGGISTMSDLINEYIGKECMIYTMSSQLAGTVKAVVDGWVSVDNGKEVEAVNLDYIVRIRPYPLTKSGKKRSLVVD